jgi:DNA-binding NarL/FixJ family response regulator
VRDYVERGGRGEEEFDVLTPRELEVLKLIAEAQTSKQISEVLFISVKTVERHRQNILDKSGTQRRDRGTDDNDARHGAAVLMRSRHSFYGAITS